VDDPHRPFSFVQVQRIARAEENVPDLLGVATDRWTLHGGRSRRAIRPAQCVSGELVVRVQPTKVNATFRVAG